MVKLFNLLISLGNLIKDAIKPYNYFGLANRIVGLESCSFKQFEVPTVSQVFNRCRL